MYYLIVTADEEVVDKARKSGAGIFTADASYVTGIQSMGNLQTNNKASVESVEAWKTNNLLRLLAIKPNIKGYDYIKYILQKCEENQDYHRCAYIKEIYPECARAFGTTSDRIQRAIRTALEKSFESNPAVYIRCFGYYGSKAPSNSQFISSASFYFANIE